MSPCCVGEARTKEGSLFNSIAAKDISINDLYIQTLIATGLENTIASTGLVKVLTRR
jgi:hypothetical protein